MPKNRVVLGTLGSILVVTGLIFAIYSSVNNLLPVLIATVISVIIGILIIAWSISN